MSMLKAMAFGGVTALVLSVAAVQIHNAAVTTAPVIVLTGSGTSSASGSTQSNGTPNNGNSGQGNNGNGNGNGPAFTISGQASGLYPGRIALPLAMSFTNTTNQPILITKLDGTVAAVNKTGCPLTTVTVSSWTGSVSVAAGGTTVSSDSLRVSMINDPAEACANAEFTLSFTGTATR